jgi:hypothetical protein
MRPVTRIEVDGLPFLNQPTTETQSVVLLPPEPNPEPREGLHSTRLAKRNAPPSPVERSRKTIRGHLRALSLPKISEGNTADLDLIVRKESPWDTFEKIFECDLAGMVAVLSGQSASIQASRRTKSLGSSVQPAIETWSQLWNVSTLPTPCILLASTSLLPWTTLSHARHSQTNSS